MGKRKKVFHSIFIHFVHFCAFYYIETKITRINHPQLLHSQDLYRFCITISVIVILMVKRGVLKRCYVILWFYWWKFGFLLLSLLFLL